MRIFTHMTPFPDLTKLQDLIPILVFLLPGFVSSGIVSLLAIRKPQDAFSRVVEAVIFTALNLAVFFIAKAILSRLAALNLTFKHFFTVDSHRFFTAGNLALLGLCAVGIGLVWSVEANKQWLFRLLLWLNVTTKSTKPSIWVDVLSEQRERYAVVHLKDGRRLVGWVSQHSDDAADRGLFLEKASWLNKDGVLINNPRIKVLVDHETGIAFIEFVEPRDDQAIRAEATMVATAATPLSPGLPEPAEMPSIPPARTSPWVLVFVVTAIGYFLWKRRSRPHDHE